MGVEGKGRSIWVAMVDLHTVPDPVHIFDGVYLVLNSNSLSIIYVGALSCLDYLSRRSCHIISFRLLW